MLKNKYIIIIIAFYIFWLGLLPFGLTRAIEPLCRNFSHNSDIEISVINPKVKFYLLPNAKFKASEIYIKSKTNQDFYKFDNASIKFRLLPLLSGNFHINKIGIQNLELKSSIDKEIKLDKNLLDKIKNTRVSCDSVNIENFKTTFFSKDSSLPALFNGKELIIRNKNRYIRFKTDGEVFVGDKNSKVYLNLVLPQNNDLKKTVFDAKITNLDIEPFGEFLKDFLPKDITKIKGLIDIEASKDGLQATLLNTAAIMQETDYSVILPQKVDVASKFDITKDRIVINELNINADNIKVTLKGKIRDYLGKNMPTVNLNISVDKSKVEDFIKLLPPFKVEEFDVYKLKKYKFYGDTIANLTVKGRLPEPDINGDVFIDNGILTKPIPNTNKGATVKLKFTGRYADYDVQVPAGFSEKVWVKGVQELYNVKYAELTVKSTKNVILPVAESVVNPLHEILNFVVGPLPILNVYDGDGNIDITVKGNRKNPHVWGALNFNKAAVNFIEIPNLNLVNADAVLSFNDKNATFQTKTGIVNGQKFDINGTCDLSGKFDFIASSQNQPTESLYRALKNSTMLKDMQKMIPDIEQLSGTSDLNLKIYGNVKEIEDLEINKNTFAKGEIKLKNNKLVLEGINIENVNGTILPDGLNASVNIAASINSSPLKLDAKIKNNIGDISFEIPKLNPNFIIKDVVLREKNFLPYISATAKYKGNINDIEYNKLNLSANILGSHPQSIFKFNSGNIEIHNNKTELKNISGFIKNTTDTFKTDLKIDETFSDKPVLTGVYKINISDIKNLNEILIEKFIPEPLRTIELKDGKFNISGKVIDNKLTADTDLTGIEFNIGKYDLPIKIINGKLSIRNNNLRLNKINLTADRMPILLDGEIKDIFEKRILDLYINSKPQQDFIDKFINKNIIYPVKIKGDIVYSATFKGAPENYDLKAKVDMSKDSSIYHYGATIGDIENSLVLNLESHISDFKNINIKEFVYDKLIDSQSGRQTKLNMLKARGGLSLLSNNDLGFKDFRIKTSNPTDARIFNIIFGKPNIKQGQFTSDLKLNGKLSNPSILGDFHIFETNIPFLDTTMKNIEFIFKDKTIHISSKGEVFGNDVETQAVLKNKLTVPYYIESALIYAKDMDLNRIVDKLKEAEVETVGKQDLANNINPKSIVAKNLKLKADKLELRNIHATDFSAETSLNESGLFNIKNFVFNIAQGNLSGNYKYNLKSNDMEFNLDAKNINANDITWAIFDLRDQIYGDLTGTLSMKCNGKNYDRCMQTLNGNTIFNVKDGKMPKLGSLEYLLKAGNLVKGGLTNLSINSIIDIITPLETGEFSDIFGSINVNKGIADDIEITTKGKNLSLFISGTYDFSNSYAEMEVLGMLSRKISTMFGPIGNISINTLFNVIPGIDLSKDSAILNNINKIPGIELTSKAYRKFLAEIKGNINGDDYVTSFSWIN